MLINAVMADFFEFYFINAAISNAICILTSHLW